MRFAEAPAGARQIELAPGYRLPGALTATHARAEAGALGGGKVGQRPPRGILGLPPEPPTSLGGQTKPRSGRLVSIMVSRKASPNIACRRPARLNSGSGAPARRVWDPVRPQILVKILQFQEELLLGGEQVDRPRESSHHLAP